MYADPLPIGGDYEEEETLVLSDTVDGYIVTSRIQLIGTDLEILPGVTVDFDGSSLWASTENIHMWGSAGNPIDILNCQDIWLGDCEEVIIWGTNFEENAGVARTTFLRLLENDFVELNDCDFNTFASGITILGGSNFISECTFTTGAVWGENHGIFLSGRRDSYQECFFALNIFDQCEIGIWIDELPEEEAYNLDIIKNIFKNCGTGISVINNRDNSIGAYSVLISNNVIYNCDDAIGTGHGILIETDGDTETPLFPHITNNAIFDNEGDGIHVEVEEHGNEDPFFRPFMMNNVLWENLGDGGWHVWLARHVSPN
jgi:hypothetical protein